MTTPDQAAADRETVRRLLENYRLVLRDNGPDDGLEYSRVNTALARLATESSADTVQVSRADYDELCVVRAGMAELRASIKEEIERENADPTAPAPSPSVVHVPEMPSNYCRHPERCDGTSCREEFACND